MASSQHSMASAVNDIRAGINGFVPHPNDRIMHDALRHLEEQLQAAEKRLARWEAQHDPARLVHSERFQDDLDGLRLAVESADDYKLPDDHEIKFTIAFARELYGLLEQYEGMKARFDSYEPGTVEGQVRAAWDLAEHHGHPEFSSKPGIVYLEEFINGLLEQLEAAQRECVELDRQVQSLKAWEPENELREQLEALHRIAENFLPVTDPLDMWLCIDGDYVRPATSQESAFVLVLKGASNPASSPPFHEDGTACPHVWKPTLDGNDYACVNCGAFKSRGVSAPASEPKP